MKGDTRLKIKHKYSKLLQKCSAFLLALIIISGPIGRMTAHAVVTDNIGTAAIEQRIGSWDDSSETHSVIGLLRLIIEKISMHLQKLETLEAKVNALDTKMDVQTNSLQQSIADSVQMANASYNLYVYMPKTIALADYSGQQVKIFSASGNQSAAATLRDDGANYSATLYYNFSGACTLSYNLLNHYGQPISTREPLTVSVASQEYQLANLTAAPSQMSWHTIHSILRAGCAAEFGLTTEGTYLPDNWYVIASGSYNGADAIRIWRKTNLETALFYKAKQIADNYKTTFNQNAGCEIAYESGLLSLTDVKSGWMATDNSHWHTDNTYWLSTNGTVGHMGVDGGVNGGIYSYNDDAYAWWTCPYLWLN